MIEPATSCSQFRNANDSAIGLGLQNLNKPFPKRQILDSSKQKELAYDNFKLNKNGEEFSKRVENTVGKEEIARYEQFLLFAQCFQKTCTAYT